MKFDDAKIKSLLQKHQGKHNLWKLVAKEIGCKDREQLRGYCRNHLGYKKNDVQKNNQDNQFDLSDFTKQIISDIDRHGQYVSPVDKERVFSGTINEDAVLMLSDSHIGKVNRFLNLETGKSEETYNTSIFVDKTNNLLDAMCSIIKILKNSYKIEHLWVVKLGDLLDNDRIYRGQQLYVDQAIGEQMWTGVRVFSDFYQELLKIFPKVTVVSVPGNHSRTTARCEEEPVTSSFDYHLVKILKVVFREEKRIKFIIPDSWFYLQEIRGWKYFMHHGNTVYSWMSLPYYGIVRQSKSRRLEIPHEIELVGHFHSKLEVPLCSNALTIVNGGWIPKDSFAWKKFGVLSKPTQHFFGISDKRPRSWSFNLEI